MNRPAADPLSLGSGFLVPISILLLCDAAAQPSIAAIATISTIQVSLLIECIMALAYFQVLPFKRLRVSPHGFQCLNSRQLRRSFISLNAEFREDSA
jgi:hypothetical protein